MTRQLLFAITVLCTSVLFCSLARAATWLQCEDRGVFCLAGCVDRTGGAGDLRGRQNLCLSRCAERVSRCYVTAHPFSLRSRSTGANW
jgi:hypothetical protein